MDYTEKERKIPVSNQADIIVCGGGTAGSIAAIAAANEGKSVIMIEQFGSLGGTATLALVTPMMHTSIEGNPMCSYISDKINNRMLNYGFSAEYNHNKGYFDPTGLKIVLEEMACEAGVQILYHTLVIDVIKEEINGSSHINGVVIQNKSGRSVITGKVFIDATGDGDLSVLSCAQFMKGDEDTGKNQPMSLRYILGGVDIKKFWNQVSRMPNQVGSTKNGQFLTTAVTNVREWALSPIFQEAMKNNDLTMEDYTYWQVFSIPGRKDGLAFNCPEIFNDIDATDAYHLSNAQIIGKKAILRQLNFYKKYLEGFDDAYISEISTMVGVRESRRIICEYILTGKELFERKKFDDGICQSNYPVDIHGVKLRLDELDGLHTDELPYYEIPYQSLVVKGFDNLLVSGRCISCDFVAQSSIRVQHSVRATGEAAGIAAAMAISNNMSVKNMDGKLVKQRMLEHGAKFF